MRLAVGEYRRVYSEPALGGSDACEFQEAAEADRDLAVERVRVIEPLIEITGDDRPVLADQLDQPGLAIVRVRGEDRMAESLKTNIR